MNQIFIFIELISLFLVNPKFVSIYSYDSMELMDGTTLTVSENRRKKVSNLFCALKGEDIIV